MNHCTMSSTEPSTTPCGSIRALSRKNRVHVMRTFLLETYRLNKRDIVLDVAGGKGDLSWLLKNIDGVDSIVVDPRVMASHSHILRSIAYLRSNPGEAQRRAVPGLTTYQPLAALIPMLEEKLDHDGAFDSPSHMRIFVDELLVEAIRMYRSTRNMLDWKDFWDDAQRKGLQAQTLGYKEEEIEPMDNQITIAEKALDVILRTRLIVGFHPDQATDACIDLALELNIPFCVCPCCVFPSEFPNRQTPEGNRVRTYNELIKYLQTKARDSHTAALNFVFTETSRNLAIFTLPKCAT